MFESLITSGVFELLDDMLENTTAEFYWYEAVKCHEVK